MRHSFILAAAAWCCLASAVGSPARGQGVSDFDAVYREYQKPSAQRDYGLIDQKIAAIVAHPETFASYQFIPARRWQIERSGSRPLRSHRRQIRLFGMVSRSI